MRQSLRAVNQRAFFLTVFSLFLLSEVAGAEAAPSEGEPSAPSKESALSGVRVGGYLQSQYESHQGSRDEVDEAGKLLNQDRFLIRRARLKVDRERAYSYFMLELDGNTKSGPSLRLFRAEAAVQYREEGSLTGPPLVKLALGLVDIPFGRELGESSKQRVFMERSRASRAFFPSVPDLGVKASGKIAVFDYALALQNGEPLGTRYALEDPNAGKDLSGRLGLSLDAPSGFELGVGASGLVGRGFHAGKDGEVSRNFERWLLGADVRFALSTPLGETEGAAEVQGGLNMDRAEVSLRGPAVSLRAYGYSLSVSQEISPYAIVGFRYDEYAPTFRVARLGEGADLSRSSPFRTFSPTLAATLPGRARLVFQYDHVRGRPLDMLTLRLQVES